MRLTRLSITGRHRQARLNSTVTSVSGAGYANNFTAANYLTERDVSNTRIAGEISVNV